MVSKKVVVGNPLGLHLRPASELCGKAVEYESRIMIRFRNREFNAKSILGILSACVKNGDEVEITCEGPDEMDALPVLVQILEKK